MSRKTAEKVKEMKATMTIKQQSESTSSYSKVSEDTAPKTSAVVTSPASSNETYFDSFTDTVIAATGAGKSDNVCCECYITFEEDIAMGNKAEWTQCVDTCGMYK